MPESTALSIPSTELDRLEREDPHWQRAHGLAACLCALLIPGGTTPMELSIAALGVVGIARIVRVMPVTITLFRSPTFLYSLAFVAWCALSLLWSKDPRQGADELADLRWILLIWLIAPAARWRVRIVACLAVGFVIGHIAQVVNGAAIFAGGPDWLIGLRTESRISGWWDPAIAGTILTGAFALHLVPALLGRGRIRLVAWAGLIAAFIGLIATGSRGGWLATATLLALVTIALLISRHTRRRVLLPAAVGGGLLGLVIAGAAITRGEQLAGRFAEARDAVVEAWNGEGYDSDTGARILMKSAAVQAYADSPVWGQGIGGYRAWAQANLEDARRIHAHAHDTALHTAATLGTVGILLGVAVLAFALRDGWRAARAGRSLYDAAPFVALLGLVCAIPYDTLHVSGQPAAVMWLLIALCSSVSKRSDPSGQAMTLGRFRNSEVWARRRAG